MAEKKLQKPKEPIIDLEVAQAHGYFGIKADPRPNSDYSLESGPEAPPTAVDGEAADYIKQRAQEKK